MTGPDQKERHFFRKKEGEIRPSGAGTSGLSRPKPQSKAVALPLLILCEVLALSLWFSSTAVIPSLKADYGLDDAAASLISSMVSVGFVIGTLISAGLGLADRLPAVRFFAGSALLAAAANAAIIFVEPTSWAVPALRLVVGMSMAGIYPVGMKLAASWAKADMGFLVGSLVGALTLGSALPHLINIAGGLDWRLTLAIASGAAVLAACLILFVRPGPAAKRAAAFRPQFALQALTRPSLRLANLGYFGHMWELYALWSWAGIFLLESLRQTPGVQEPALWAMVLTFTTVGSGAIGSIAGGVFADRLGRTTLTMIAMAISGTCALASGFVFGMSPWILAPLFVLWGITVVADSAQFSSSVMELADPWLIGTMVTVQTCLGFLLTVATIHLVPLIAEQVGWQWSFAFLAIGPYLGVIAMGRLRAHPDAVKLAGGKR